MESVVGLRIEVLRRRDMLRADWVTLNPIDYTLRVFVSKEDAFELRLPEGE